MPVRSLMCTYRVDGYRLTSRIRVSIGGIMINESRFVARFAAVNRQCRIKFKKIDPATMPRYQARLIVKDVK